MRFLFVADPVSRLKKQSDTTFAFLREALAQEAEAYWATDADISARSAQVFVSAARVRGCEKNELPSLDSASPYPIDHFDVVMVRKDPPFDLGYIQLCWVLSYAESKVYFMNRPSLLVRFHEKILPLEAVAQGFLDETDIIPTFYGDWERATTYFKAHKVDKIIVKPFWGFGGSDVSLYSLADFQKLTPSRELIVQPFQPEISEGDRRVFFLDGQILASVVRVPKAGSIISNLAQGGTGVSKPIRTEERRALEKLGRFLKAAGIHLAGADVIGDRISEVNITSPTGIRSIEGLENRDYSKEIVQFAKKCAFYGR